MLADAIVDVEGCMGRRGSWSDRRLLSSFEKLVGECENLGDSVGARGWDVSLWFGVTFVAVYDKYWECGSQRMLSLFKVLF